MNVDIGIKNGATGYLDKHWSYNIKNVSNYLSDPSRRNLLVLSQISWVT